MNSELKKLLAVIRSRPGLFPVDGSVRFLFVFLCGWLDGKGYPEMDSMYFRGFGDHIHRRYRDSRTNSWADVLQEAYPGQEACYEAFWKELERYDRYLKRKAGKIDTGIK